MAIDEHSQTGTNMGGDELSPLKRALIEIRRLRAELEEATRRHSEPVAIIGMAVRLPGGIVSPEQYWKALADGENLISTIPPERWEAVDYWNSNSERPGTMYDVHGGFLSNIDAFDAEFFGIHPREAASMDPQHRILMELTWEALERAAIDPRNLMDTLTGIYLALTNSDYGRLLTENESKIDGYTAVGAAGSIAAGRIAYFLGTHGPALVTDTACSSSLVAVHQAVQGLRQKQTTLAIVGSANLILSPAMNVGFSRTGMLSRSGQSSAFDASADGYVRSEGCCVIVLKRLADATRDGDPILASINGTAVNQDGRSAGITAPNGPAQEALMRTALVDAGLEPGAVSYIEAHGTGTPLGDPIEIQAIGTIYGSNRPPESPLLIGSVKTNLGHTEASAGLTGLIKVVLMMQPGAGIVPHLHFNRPSPHIDWKRWPIEVPVQMTPWNDMGATRYAGVSSFGFSGTNAHLIVASISSTAQTENMEDTSGTVTSEDSLLCLSAKHPSSLRLLAERYVIFLRTSKARFEDICYTAAMGRAQFVHRLAIISDSKEKAAAMLERWLADQSVDGLLASRIDGVDPTEPEDDSTSLSNAQRSFIAGGSLRSTMQVFRGNRKVDLPVSSFQPRRFWFGDAPIVKRAQLRLQAWSALTSEAVRQSRQGPLNWNPAAYSLRSNVLTRLTRAHARKVLVASAVFDHRESFTPREVLDRCGIRPIYANLIKRWLSDLAANGVLWEEGGRYGSQGALHSEDLELYWHEAERSLTDDPGALAYLKQCGALLGDVLTGRRSALETLFPGGSFALAEGIYESSAEARYFNPIVASSVRAAVEVIGRHKPVRILEIGGGTGGTTSAILPLLPSDRIEYQFTDVSELFLRRAMNKFGQYPYVSFGLFDIDHAIEDQGIQPGTFDLVVAANVIHAARSLESTLARTRSLLTTNGALILLETTTHQPWFDMSTGLIEGWQHFDDSERKEHPLLDPSQWKSALERAGFEHAVALPFADSPAAGIGQHVILAKRKELADDENSAATQWILSPLHQPVALRPTTAVSAPTLESQQSSLLASEETVAKIVRDTICSVFQLETLPHELGDRDRLSDLGMDSLIALELRSELSKRLNLERISSTIAFDTGTVGELIRALVGMLARPSGEPLQPADLASSLSQRAKPEPVTAEQLKTMSDEDVEQLLKERMSRQ